MSTEHARIGHAYEKDIPHLDFVVLAHICEWRCGPDCRQLANPGADAHCPPGTRYRCLNGKIYAIGGYDSSGRPTNIVEVYDPTTNTWTSAHPIPVALHHNSAAVAAELYSFGGPFDADVRL